MIIYCYIYIAGIRRLVCITGIEAKNIIIFGDLLLKELENLNIKINNIDINFNIEEIESLEKEMNEIRYFFPHFIIIIIIYILFFID